MSGTTPRLPFKNKKTGKKWSEKLFSKSFYTFGLAEEEFEVSFSDEPIKVVSGTAWEYVETIPLYRLQYKNNKPHSIIKNGKYGKSGKEDINFPNLAVVYSELRQSFLESLQKFRSSALILERAHSDAIRLDYKEFVDHGIGEFDEITGWSESNRVSEILPAWEAFTNAYHPYIELRDPTYSQETFLPDELVELTGYVPLKRFFDECDADFFKVADEKGQVGGSWRQEGFEYWNDPYLSRMNGTDNLLDTYGAC